MGGRSGAAVRETVLSTARAAFTESKIQPPPAAPSDSGGLGGYRILRALGKGGMGAVYEAEEIESGRRVALKVLSQALDSPEARRRFLREGRMAASVNHPNTVYVFGTDEIDGQPVIAMELVGGGTLQERVKEGQPMAVAGAVDAILQVIAGLEAAAAMGVLHRDIKPSNCFVETDGTIKVGDFGLSRSTAARQETKLTLTGSFLGTPAFSSPEQLRGDEFSMIAWTLLMLSALPSLVAALLFRGGLVLRVLGLAVVKKDGAKASRLRIFWRSLIAWFPALLLALLAVLLVPLAAHFSWKPGWLSLGCLAPTASLVIWAALWPERGLQDRLAGTCLVPRE